MMSNQISNYVDQFGKLINQPDNYCEVEQLLLSIPDPKTFELIRSSFYEKFNHPLLTTFLDKLNPDEHLRVLNAYRRAMKDYA